jgi:nucleoside phosphorylase
LKIDVLIIVALKIELDAVLENDDRGKHPWKEYLEHGDIRYHRRDLPRADPERPLLVAVAWAGHMGQVATAVEMTLLIERLDPACIAMTGICAGKKAAGVEINDIIVADRVYDYERGKWTAYEANDHGAAEGFRPDGEVFRMDHAWLRDAAYYADGDWKKEPDAPKVHFGPIATGSKVVQDWDLFTKLAFQCRKTLGADMEAAAVGYAAYRTRRPMIVAKGVSDHANAEKADAPQRDAALASARFVLSFLKQHRIPARPTRTFDLQRDAYAELLSYIADHKVKHAVLIQYSDVVATDIVFNLMRREADLVDVYVQHEESMQDERQKERFRQGETSLKLYLSNLPKPPVGGRLVYHFYRPLASVRAVLLDDAVLAIGWYTYRHIQKNPVTGPYMVRGAEAPGLVAYRGSPDFNVFRDFIKRTAEELDERAEDKDRREYKMTANGLEP